MLILKEKCKQGDKNEISDKKEKNEYNDVL